MRNMVYETIGKVAVGVGKTALGLGAIGLTGMISGVIGGAVGAVLYDDKFGDKRFNSTEIVDTDK